MAACRPTLAIDRDTASRLGITPQLIDNTLYDAFGQRQVSTIFTQLNQYHVVLEVNPAFQQNPGVVDEICMSQSGNGDAGAAEFAFTQLQTSNAPLAVNHQGQFPVVTLSFNLAPGVSLGDAIDAINKAEKEIGMPASVQAEFPGHRGGVSELAGQRTVADPGRARHGVHRAGRACTRAISIPSPFFPRCRRRVSARSLALLISHTDLSVIALIGIILLIGIVKKNAIMMIDFALEAEREEGKPPEEAIYQACLLRFRPIMMTTMAALLGGLPLALGTGTGSELRRPLGITIIGGLIFSQLLTLYTTPVVYLCV